LGTLDIVDNHIDPFVFFQPLIFHPESVILLGSIMIDVLGNDFDKVAQIPPLQEFPTHNL
jgi:hypothetical protein